jgi:hypothetical protein
VALLLSAHVEGWKRLQESDTISLISRILFRLTPLTSDSTSSNGTGTEPVENNRLSPTGLSRLSPIPAATRASPTGELLGATTESSLLRSQSCYKVLNLVQHLMKVDGAAGVLRRSDGPSRPKPALPLNGHSTSSDKTASSGSDESSSLSEGVSTDGKAIMRSVTRVLMAGPRNMLWFPALLRAAEVLQLLILEGAGAEEFLATMHSERMPLAQGTLESHILLDMLHSINSTLQPQRLRAVSSLEHHSVDL